MSKMKVGDVPQQADGCCGPEAPVPLTGAEAVDMAKGFKALGDPVRLQLLSMIASKQECCVCDLTEPFDLTGPTISYHLKILREAALVESERRGTWVYYRASRETLATLSGLLGSASISLATVA
jgi:ArsR family transcriptional regulator